MVEPVKQLSLIFDEQDSSILYLKGVFTKLNHDIYRIEKNTGAYGSLKLKMRISRQKKTKNEFLKNENEDLKTKLVKKANFASAYLFTALLRHPILGIFSTPSILTNFFFILICVQ